MDNPPDSTLRLSTDIRQLIESARHRVASAINAELTQLYWHIGRRINDDLLQGKRAGYGQEVVRSLAVELTLHYGRGWGERHLRHCMRFAEIFADEAIVNTVCSQFNCKISCTNPSKLPAVNFPKKKTLNERGRK